MDKKELKVINDTIREKYKYHKVWKILSLVFICLTILFAMLYFASGDMFRQTTNNNDVEIVNNGDSNDNNVTINN